MVVNKPYTYKRRKFNKGYDALYAFEEVKEGIKVSRTLGDNTVSHCFKCGDTLGDVKVNSFEWGSYYSRSCTARGYSISKPNKQSQTSLAKVMDDLYPLEA